ncbi:MAG TPA: D-alanine--D-alanine ligase [Planctomycetales bacterium]|jgi:D-alanine-D-alanine ligase|nr:D-alanine--D-alanine ligase [Planctomycetales bacterium]
MKITILNYLEHEGDKKHDTVVDQVARALKQSKHKVSVLGVHGNVNQLRTGLLRRKPDLVFNLMETFGSNQLGAVGVVGLLDLLSVPYTGGGPGEFYIQEDKGLTKKLLSFDGIKYPEFAIFSQDAELETGGHLHMPLFVKPLRMDASIGISGKSLVHSTKEMIERVTHIHKTVNDAALVEEYIEGREFYVGVLGNQEPQAFPAIEMDFSGMPEGMAHVLDSKAKWDEKSAEYKGTKAILADIPDEVRARLQKVAVDAYRALRVRDYGRIDMRLTPTGEVYVIEVNASCYLEQTGEFSTSAEAAGMDYPTLINRIAELAFERYKSRKAAKA